MLRLFSMMTKEGELSFNKTHTKTVGTPVSVLFELCAKSYTAPPIYTLINSDNQWFSIECFLGESIHAIGEANNKKKAKHIAALKVLKQLVKINQGVNDSLAEKLNEIITNLKKIDLDDEPRQLLELTNSSLSNECDINLSDIQVSNLNKTNLDLLKNYILNCKNPVGELETLSRKYKINRPSFIFENDGPAHDREFFCEASFDIYKDSAISRSKRLAKKHACYRLLFKIKASGRYGAFTSEENQPKKQIQNETKSPKQNIMDQLKTSKNKTINLIFTNNIEVKDSRFLLEQMCTEEKISYNILSIQKFQDMVIYAVELLTEPRIFYGAFAKSSDVAINRAAFFALSHLKMICTGKNI
ncbi:unnamed protein product [Brachionus calyciflorus]|uniref:DRBM domain-containing protein n=1 Tax=Brachionus calyciflorus TaxID=104777 RepID=A0A814BPU7_9BILA|nr:unnamed protein product [Brachionus calyciflorus]